MLFEKLVVRELYFGYSRPALLPRLFALPLDKRLDDDEYLFRTRYNEAVVDYLLLACKEVAFGYRAEVGAVG